MTLRFRAQAGSAAVPAVQEPTAPAETQSRRDLKPLALCFMLLLPSCIAAGGRGDSWAAVSVGTDARRLSASRAGLEVEEMNQSRGLEMARKQLRNAALIGAGVPAIKEVAKEAIP